MTIIKTVLAIAGLLVLGALLVSDIGTEGVSQRGYSPRKTDLVLDKPDKWEPKSKK